MWLGSQWILAMWKLGLPLIKRSSGELFPGQCIHPWYFVIWGSNKFESVISSLSVPWIPGVSFRLRFWFTSLVKSIFPRPRAIYMGYGCGSNNNPLCLKPSTSLYSSCSSIGLRLWRTARCMLWRVSMDLYHRTSASIVKRVHLVMPSLPWGIGPTLFGL